MSPGYAGADPGVSGYCGAVCTPEEAAVVDGEVSSLCAAGSFASVGVAAGVCSAGGVTVIAGVCGAVFLTVGVRVSDAAGEAAMGLPQLGHSPN